MTDVGSHWELTIGPWSKQPRFYPPGQHPAMARWYETLANAERCLAETRRVEEKGGILLAKEGLLEMIAYAQEQIAAFEQVESELKAKAALRGR